MENLEDNKVVLTSEEYQVLLDNQRKQRGRKKDLNKERKEILNFRLPISFIEKFHVASKLQHASHTSILYRIAQTNCTLQELCENYDSLWIENKSHYEKKINNGKEQ